MYLLNDNIVALSTPAGQSALAVIRVSGEAVILEIDKLFSKDIVNAKGYSMHYGFISTVKNEALDEVIISVFRNPNSFTGENMVEISCHGSPVGVNLIVQELISLPNFRLAEPGEFSLRAFQNKKMDLVKAESIADLIHSESESAHKVAIHQLKEGFSSKLKSLRQELVDFAALLELELDFGEEDVEFAKRGALRELCSKIADELSKLIQSFKFGNAIKNGINTAIVGKPNAGKSTLLNALLNEERAIVSDIAGTTRDTIIEKLVIDGVQFNIIDTAGLRDNTEDKIEAIGIERTKNEIKKAELVIYCLDATENINSLQEEMKKVKMENTHFFFTKEDLLTTQQRKGLLNAIDKVNFIAANNQNVDSLLKLLQQKASELSSLNAGSLVTNQRHLVALKGAEDGILQAIAGIDNQMYIEQVASDLKQALYYLGTITGGDIDANEVLGSVFSRFCIGK